MVYCDLVDFNAFCIRLGKLLNVKEEDVPVIFILKSLSTLKLKYKMNIGQQLEKRKIKEFYMAFKHGEIYPYLLSEDEPEFQKNTFLHKIVANTFKGLVLDSSYDALVIFDSD